MHRFTDFAAVAVLFALSLTGCDEFEGVFGTIGGQVSIEGTGIDGVTVTLSDGSTTTTSGGGTFLFTDVPADIYTVLISGYPTDAVFDRTAEVVIILADGSTHNVNFNGVYLRTSSIWGRVTADGRGLGGVEVRLAGPSNSAAITTPNGQYALSSLRAGEYTVSISGFDPSEVGFESTTQTVTVLPHESRIVGFDGEYLRSAAITGRVTVAGEGLAGVTVNLSGPEGETDATRTDAAGAYTFSELRAGDYSLDISGYDADEYEFDVTSTTVTLAGGETANVPFEGFLLRSAEITGRVTGDGVGLDSVTVILSGAASDTTTTADGGRYRFAGLRPGVYKVEITGYDAATYRFDNTESLTFTLERGESTAVDFDGAATLAASIVGYLYIDENPKNDRFDPGREDLLRYQGFPLVLQGPGTTDSRSAVTDSVGGYTFGALKAGTYRVVPDLTPAAVEALAELGYAYGGPPMGAPVVVSGGAATELYLPIDITHQTITVRAVLALGDRVGPVVEGVAVDLYGTSADADAETDPLASAVTDSTGTASFTFPRAEESDGWVFSRVSALPYEMLAVTTNARMALIYPLRRQTTAATEHITLVNRRADLQFTARVIETARSGGGPLEDWDAEYVTGDPGSGAVANATPVELVPTDTAGMVAFHVLPAAADLPVTYTVRLADDQLGALGEQFEQTPLPSEDADSGAATLTYTHYGLRLPGDTLDLGEIEVRFTTQSLVVGVHWERDEEPGYTTEGIYSDLRPNRSRPDIDIAVLVRDPQGHLRPYRNPDPNHDINVHGHTRNPDANGLVVFRNLPADTEFIVDADIGEARTLTSRGLVDTWQDFGAYDLGAFGTQSGGTPEVWICPRSTRFGRSRCSTFGYLWTNGEVWGWVGSADYGGDPTPNDTIADRFGVSAPDVFANGLGVTLTYTGTLVTYEESTQVGLESAPGEFLVGDGEFLFTRVPTGSYTLSVPGNDEWGPSEVSFRLLQNADAEATDSTAATGARKAVSVTVPYLKTSISGTVANDVDGNGQAAPEETASGIEMELLRVQGSDTVATSQSDTTTVFGAFSFTDIAEGPYVVKASGNGYFVAGTNTEPIDHSPVLTTDARPEKREITSGDALPVWDDATELIDADAGQSGSQSAVTDFTDADFIVLPGTGTMSGTVTRTDDGNTTDTDTVPDPFGGLTVYVDYCEAADGTRCQPGRFAGRVEATTRADGTWEATGLREGHHLVTVNIPADAWGYGTPPGDTEPRRSYFEQLEGADATQDSLDFHLVPLEDLSSVGSLSGRVTRTDDGGTTDSDSDPDPFGGLTVRVDHCEVPADSTSCQPGRFGERVSVETRADGTWEATGLPEGYHRVTVDISSGAWGYGTPPGHTQPRQSYFEQLAGADTTRDSLDFHLVPLDDASSVGSLSGRVTRTDDGSTTDANSDPDPFGGLTVRVDHCEEPADANSCQPGRYGDRVSVDTNDDGTWEAEEVNAGYHLVTVDLPSPDWEYGAPRGDSEPRYQYFVEVEGTGSSAGIAAHASSLQEEGDTLDFHFVPRDDGGDRNPVYGVLVIFYNTTGGPIWNDRTNWLTGKPVDEWHGVVTDDDGNVVELALPGNNLRFTPTPLLDSLVHLKRLDLSSNGLESIPSTFGNLDSLTVLDLSGNNLLRGSIPASFGDLTQLDTLDLELTRLSGPIPPELGNLTGLDYLNLGRADLTGTIPEELGNLTNLRKLVLEGNELSGTIPAELGDLSNLEVLDLSDNDLTGTITTDLGDLSNLVDLNLGGNELTGAVPDALTSLTKLQKLRLGGNQLTGVPSDMSGMTALRWVWLDDNSFSGLFPASLFGIPNLASLDIGENSINDTIPHFTGKGLDGLLLDNNKFRGSIPAALGDIASLYGLDLHGNDLTGAIPGELGSLSRIRSIWLQNNSLTGNIPSEFGNLGDLQELLVNGNSGLAGTLPSTLTSLTSLTWFQAQNTSLCAPTDSAFQTWLSGVGQRNVANCS